MDAKNSDLKGDSPKDFQSAQNLGSSPGVDGFSHSSSEPLKTGVQTPRGTRVSEGSSLQNVGDHRHPDRDESTQYNDAARMSLPANLPRALFFFAWKLRHY